MQGAIPSWQRFLNSNEFKHEWQHQLELSEGEPMQIKATSAVAVTLSAFVRHGLLGLAGGGRPEDAMVVCPHYGGDTDTTASMCGA